MKLAKYIDHTILKANIQKTDIDQLIKEAISYQFAAVCVNSSWVKYCALKLANSSVNVCSVIGFPLGAMSLEAKVFETKQALIDGADEIDMVINIGKLLDGENQYILKEIKAVKTVMGNKILKVIIETALLSKKQIIKISQIVSQTKADFIKTSTGFSTAGANFKDVQLMLNHISTKIQVKASGGIKTYKQLVKYIDMGVTRVGTSSGIKLLKEEKK